jgi:hypothetical protein
MIETEQIGKYEETFKYYSFLLLTVRVVYCTGKQSRGQGLKHT